MEIRVSMHKRFAQISKEESWTSIFELRVQFGQTWRNKKRKKDRNFKLYRKNVHIYIYIYLFNVTQNIGIYIREVVCLERV